LWLLLLGIWPILALYQEDTGKQDFYRENVGIVQDAFLAKDRLFVISNENVVASLDTRQPSIGWRYLLSQPILSSVASPHGIVTLSGTSSLDLHVFSLDGSLVWSDGFRAASAQGVHFNENVVVLLNNNTLHFFNAKTGESLQQFVYSEGTLNQIYSVTNETLWALGRSDSTDLVVLQFDLSTYTLTNTFPVFGKVELPPKGQRLLTNNQFIWLSACGNNLVLHRLGESSFRQFEISTYPELIRGGINGPSTLQSIDETHFIISSPEGSSLFQLTESTSEPFVFLKKIGKGVVISNGCQMDGESYFLSSVIGESAIDVHKLDSSAPERRPLPTLNNPSKTTSGEEWLITKLWVQAPLSAFRVLSLSVDGSLRLLKSSSTQSNLIWERFEATSHIIQSKFIDLPPNKEEIELFTAEFGGSYFQRIIADATGFISGTVSFVKKLLKQEGQTNSLVNTETKDNFGYRKLIISITDMGNVFAMKTPSGEMLWSRYYSNNLKKFFVTRNLGTHFAVSVFMTNSQGEWFFTELNSMTGEVITNIQKLNHGVKHILPIPTEGPKFKPLLIIDEENQGHAFPDALLTRQALINVKDRLFFSLFNKQTATLQGYKVNLQGNTVASASLLWSKCYSPTGPKITDQPQTEDSIEVAALVQNNVNTHAPARVLGDGSVLWKYLNPHLLAIGTINKGDQSVTINLIDTITGQQLYSIKHTMATGPLHIVASSNWVVYSLWSSKFHQYQISVLDLYETQAGWNKTEFSSYTAPNIFQARGKINVVVQTQSFFFPVGVQSIASTVTRLGITNPQILLALGGGHIMALDKRFVDSRRPPRPRNQPTEDDMKEGIMPYYPYIEINPLRFISYNQTVLNVRSFEVAPSNLESTTHLVAHGLDVFYAATTAGGKTYDRLDPDFDKQLLLIVCLVIVLVSWISHLWAKNAALKEAWK